MSAAVNMASTPVNMASAASLFRCRCLSVDIPSGSVREQEVGAVSIKLYAQLSQPIRFFYDVLQEPAALAITGVGCDRTYGSQHAVCVEISP